MAEMDFSAQNLTSLDSLLPSLSADLHSLDLSSNALAVLPDLSQLHSLQHLDVAGNRFPDAESVLCGLVALPALTSLNVDLEPQELKLLVARLPNLQLINGRKAHVSDFQDKVNSLFSQVKSLRTAPPSARDDRIEARLWELSADLEAKEEYTSADQYQRRSLLITKRAFLACLKDALRPLLAEELQSLITQAESLENDLFLELADLAPTRPVSVTPLSSPRKAEDSDTVAMELEPEMQRISSRRLSAEPVDLRMDNIALRARVEGLEADVLALINSAKAKSAEEEKLVKELEGLLEQACTAGSVRLDSVVVRGKEELISTLEKDVSELSQYKETAISAIYSLEAALRNREAEVRELKYELGGLEEREKEAREGERKKAEELVAVQGVFERELREAQRKAEECQGGLAEKKEPSLNPPHTPSTSHSILPLPNPISRPTKKFLLDRPDSHSDKPLFSFLEQLNPIPTPSFSGLNLSLGTPKSEKEPEGVEKRCEEYERRIEKMAREIGISEEKVRELEDLLEGQRQLYHIEKDQLLSRCEQRESALSDLAATCSKLEKEKEDLKTALESLKSLLRKEGGTQELGTFEESPVLSWSGEGESPGKELKADLDLGRFEGSLGEESTPLSSSPRFHSLSLIHSLLRPYTQPPDDLLTTLSRLIDELEKLRKRKTGVVVPKLILRLGVAHREIQTSPKGEMLKGIEGKGSPESGNRGISAMSTEQDSPRHKALPQMTSDQLYSMHSRLQGLEMEVLEAARAKESAEAEVRKVREEREEMAPGVGGLKELLFKVLSMLPKQ